tara:strand:+ start:249 stop:581 length:333 start_codon:yes stop_codon:yes gene_type:complete
METNTRGLVWPYDEGSKPVLRHQSESLEDIRNLTPKQLDPNTLMQLTGYKDWIYMPGMAKAIATGAEGHEDWCAETVMWAFDWATTRWEFDRECCDILLRAWLPGECNAE